MIKKLIELRNKLKAKKPTFTRHDAHKKKRVGAGWRKPKGHQNKMRLNRKGYASARSTGYSSPVAVKGLSREGFVQTIVANVADFTGLDPQVNGVIVARTVGNRKRSAILAHAKEKGFSVLNVDQKAFENKIKAVEAEKKAHKKSLEERKKAQAAASKKADKKSEKKEAEPSSQEDKKVVEKKEKDKLLTKKGEVQ